MGRQDYETETLIAQSIGFSCKDYGADASSEIAPTMRAMGHSGSHANAGGQLAAAIAFDSRQDPVSSEHVFGALGSSSPQAQAVCITGDITHTLKAEGFDASEDGTGRGQPIVAAAFDVQQITNPHNRASVADGAPAPTMAKQSRMHAIAGMAVRRLTPRECERLQGFPDDYTRVPVRGKQAADGPRYKAIGNSMAVTVMQWLGKRIALVADLGESHRRPALTQRIAGG